MLRGCDDDLADEECEGDGGCFGWGEFGVLILLVGMRKPPAEMWEALHFIYK